MSDPINIWRDALDELTLQQPNALAALTQLPLYQQKISLQAAVIEAQRNLIEARTRQVAYLAGAVAWSNPGLLTEYPQRYAEIVLHVGESLTKVYEALALLGNFPMSPEATGGGRNAS